MSHLPSAREIESLAVAMAASEGYPWVSLDMTSKDGLRRFASVALTWMDQRKAAPSFQGAAEEGEEAV